MPRKNKKLDAELETINHGVIYGRNPLGTDYLAAELPYEIVVPSGDHTPWVPTNESQTGGAGTDRYNCVTQAHHNCIENTLMRDIAMGRMPQTHIDWLRANGYFDANGKVNFSERFNSITNETIPGVGNYVWKVCEDGRTVGLIPQSMLPDIPTMPTVEYYNKSVITAAMRAKAKEFLTWFVLPYGWVGNTSDAIDYHLKDVSLMVTKPGHEIVGVKRQSVSYLKINDSYNPYLKDLQYNRISDVMKVKVQYIIKQGVSMAKVTNDNNTIRVEFGEGAKKVSFGINSQKLYNEIVASGEPIVPASGTSKQVIILEEGIIGDQE